MGVENEMIIDKQKEYFIIGYKKAILSSELIKNKIQCDIEKQKKLEKIKQDLYNQLINCFSQGDK